jgi:hypothetical protein
VFEGQPDRLDASCGPNGLRVSYDWMGDRAVRTLKTVEAVEQFLYGPFDSKNEASPEVESWDADMGL